MTHCIDNRSDTAKDIFRNSDVNLTNLSYDIVNRILNNNGLIAFKKKSKPFLSEDNNKKRLEFA